MLRNLNIKNVQMPYSYTTMEVKDALDRVRTYSFEPNAGFVLKTYTDVHGNETVYTYSDVIG